MELGPPQIHVGILTPSVMVLENGILWRYLSLDKDMTGSSGGGEVSQWDE